MSPAVDPLSGGAVADPNRAPQPEPTRFEFLDAALRLVWPVILVQILVVALLVIPGQGQDILDSALRWAPEAGYGFKFLAVAFVFTFFIWLMTRTVLGRNRRRNATLNSHFRFSFAPWVSVIFLFLLGISQLSKSWFSAFYLFISAIIFPVLLEVIFRRPSRRKIEPTAPPRRALRELSIWILIGSSVVSPALFIAAAFFPVTVSTWIGYYIGSYAILFLGSLLLLTLLLVTVGFIYMSRRPVLLGIGLAVWLGGLFFLSRDDHQIRTLEDSHSRLAQDSRASRDGRYSPVELEDAIRQWQTANPHQPMILVAAAGGGVRAGYWTGLVLGRIQDQYPQFRRRLFAISGVSGGAVGAAAFVAALTPDPPQCKPAERYKKDGAYERCIKTFLANDFLSPILASVFTGDLLRQFTGDRIWESADFWLPVDRAAAIEGAWEVAWSSTFSDNPQVAGRFERDFGDLWSGSPVQRPGLLLNGTSAISGKRLVTSNLNLRDKRGDPIWNPVSAYPLRLSTAVDNSTRFPFIEPAGGLPVRIKDPTTGEDVRKMDYVVDGGYYDNYGAATLLDVIWKLPADQQLTIIQITSDPEIFDRLDAEAAAASNQTCGAAANSKPAASSGDLGNLYKAAMAARSWTGLEYAEQLQGLGTEGSARYRPGTKWFPVGIRCVEAPLGWDLSSSFRDSIDKLPGEDPRVKSQMDRLLAALK